MKARRRSRRLGDHLVELGVLTETEREEGVQSQVVYGGRLGTNLVELGYLSTDDLARHLVDMTGVPAAPAAWLDRPDPVALKAVPQKLVEKHRVLPMQIEGRTIHVAMLDPLDPGQTDDIAFATRLNVRPYIVPELRLLYALELHYGIDRDLRFVDVAERLVRARGPTESAKEAAAEAAVTGLRVGEQAIDEADLAAAPAFTPLEAEPPPLPAAPLPLADPWTLPEDVTQPEGALTPPSAAARSEAGPGPQEVAALEASLARPTDRDSIARDAVRIARAYASAAALFAAHRGTIVGSRGAGAGLEARVEGTLIPMDAESVLADTAASGRPFRGAPCRSETDARFFELLGRRDVREAAVLPVRIRDRVVNLLYADNAGEPLPETAFAALEALCTCIARAYEKLILERKQRS